MTFNTREIGKIGKHPIQLFLASQTTTTVEQMTAAYFCRNERDRVTFTYIPGCSKKSYKFTNAELTCISGHRIFIETYFSL